MTCVEHNQLCTIAASAVMKHIEHKRITQASKNLPQGEVVTEYDE